jgi:4-alpha-glucanotransferase
MRQSDESIQSEEMFCSQVFVVDIVSDSPGLYWYYFIIDPGDHALYYGNNPKGLGGIGGMSESVPMPYQLTVYQPMEIAPWFRHGIMYQIFVDRFYNGNDGDCLTRPGKKSLLYGDWYEMPSYHKDAQGKIIYWDFFGGNLQGIIRKLSYLKGLGVTILYLNPIFAAESNHKYDTADYHQIDPMFGNEQVFGQLIQAADALGMAVILDGVFNHTGSDSVYFNRAGNYPSVGACQSPESPYYSWYRFTQYPDQYDCWWGIETLPNVEELDPSYQQFIFQGDNSVIRYWMRRGVKGWRLDVADELPDEFIQSLRRAVKEENPEAVLIGEVWEDASNKVSYGRLREYLWGNELDSLMNYPLRNILVQFVMGTLTVWDVYAELMRLWENYPRENTYALMNLIGSHDVLRILTLLGEAPAEEELSEEARRGYRLSQEARTLGIRRLKMLMLVQMTWPGVPCIYYGDEAGLEGYTDPYNRAAYPWGRENQEILDWTRRLTRLRREYEVFTEGKYRLFVLGEDILGYRISGREEEVIVLINRNAVQDRQVYLNLLARGMRLRYLEQAIWQEIHLDEPHERESHRDLVLELLSGQVLLNSTSGESGDIGNTLNLPALGAQVLYAQRKSRVHAVLPRACGVLLSISSLPSLWGCGDLGAEARVFVDQLAEAGQSLWQVLPYHPPGEGDSPYQSRSVFAGNEQWISVEALVRDGLLSEEDIRTVRSKHVLLRLAYQRFVSLQSAEPARLSRLGQEFTAFQREHRYWLEDYALYATLREKNAGIPWQQWDEALRSRSAEGIAAAQAQWPDEIGCQAFVQYVFFKQWQELKTYAQRQGIRLIGDLPIYIAEDSCDAWVNRDLVALDEQGVTMGAGGAPPDDYCADGQCWGNPVYRWDVMEQAGFAWWKERMRLALKMTDYVRLDHFRGFEAYWEVPAGAPNAAYGYWLKGPGQRFFAALEAEFGVLPVIAEDLGFITPEVRNLKNLFGFPGMLVWQFAQQEHDVEQNSVYYSGTHDNDTLLGWVRSGAAQGAPLSSSAAAGTCADRITCNACIEKIFSSRAAWAIIPMQDLLGLDSTARMNTPGTVGGANWRWQMKKSQWTAESIRWLRGLAERYGRTH